MDESEPSPFGPGNPDRPSLRYLFLRFLRYGLLAWGGPVAQIGLMHREVVERDRWVGEERFRKTLALYQALPGPEANELAVYFGMDKRGRMGGLLTGLGFMLPGVFFVTLLAFLYVEFGATSAAAEVLLYGVRPAVVALVAAGFVRLLRVGAPTPQLFAIVAGAAAASFFLDVGFLLILAVGGLLGLALEYSKRGLAAFALLFVLGKVGTFPALSPGGLAALAIVSAKVGLLTFGGAYTAVPFLQDGAVDEHGWITNDEFLDALALSGMVPGPFIAVGVFVGYQAAALPGALLATLLIFAPAFAFTLFGHRFFERVVHEPRLHAFLLGITAAVVGLIATTTAILARDAIVDVPTVAIGLLSLAALLSRRVPIPVVILAAAAAGALLLRST
ncbi:MAG: chromate efflux transporter [Methanobacteriota archaeon]